MTMLAISAPSTLAPFSARDTQLEAFTVTFKASRLLTSTSFPVLQSFPKHIFSYLLFESVRVSLEDVLFGFLDNISLVFCIAAAFTTAIYAAYGAVSKAFTVKFKALGL